MGGVGAEPGKAGFNHHFGVGVIKLGRSSKEIHSAFSGNGNRRVKVGDAVCRFNHRLGVSQCVTGSIAGDVEKTVVKVDIFGSQARGMC